MLAKATTYALNNSTQLALLPLSNLLNRNRSLTHLLDLHHFFLLFRHVVEASLDSLDSAGEFERVQGQVALNQFMHGLKVRA